MHSPSGDWGPGSSNSPSPTSAIRCFLSISGDLGQKRVSNERKHCDLGML